MRYEDYQTEIYINEHKILHCKFLLINIPKEKLREYDKIESIDEAYDVSTETLESYKFKVDPQIEFWGHCSNLQAWYENNYDTRILHSNLSFPLLRLLTKAEDPLAKKVFKDEIFKRFKSNHHSVINYLLERYYLNDFTIEELTTLSETLKDPELKLLTKHHHILHPRNLPKSQLDEKRKSFVKDLITEFKRSDSLLSLELLINKNYLLFFHSEDLKELSKCIKSDLKRRVLPFYAKEKIEFNKKGYDVVISEILWIKPIEKDKFDKENYSTVYSLNDRNNFKKINIDAVYYDFDVIKKYRWPVGWIERLYIQYKDFWMAYRFLNKNHDCKLYIPNYTISYEPFRTFRMVSENEGYSITISANSILLNFLEEKRDRRRKRLYKRIKKRRFEKFRELCIDIYKTQIDKDKCMELDCCCWYTFMNQCSCVYEGESLSRISSGLAYSCMQKDIFEKNKVFEFYRNRLRRLWKFKEEKDFLSI